MTGEAAEPTALAPFVGDATVVCIDMWDSLSVKQPLTDGERHNDGVRVVLEHNLAVHEEFSDVVAEEGVQGWVVKALGDGLMFVFPAVGNAVQTACAALLVAAKAVTRCARTDVLGGTCRTAAALAHGAVDLRPVAAAAPTYSAIVEVQGYPVDVASRLVAIAGRDQILVCDQVSQLLPGTWLEELPSRAPGVDASGDAARAYRAALRPDRGRMVRLTSSADAQLWPAVRTYQLVRTAVDGEDEPYVGQGDLLPIRNRTAYRSQLGTVIQLTERERRKWKMLHRYAHVEIDPGAAHPVAGPHGDDLELREVIEERIEEFGTFAAKVSEAEELVGTPVEEHVVGLQGLVAELFQLTTRHERGRRGTNGIDVTVTPNIVRLVSTIHDGMEQFSDFCQKLQSELYRFEPVGLDAALGRV